MQIDIRVILQSIMSYMYEQEKIKPYDQQEDKGKLVEQMFDNIAPTYDTLNHRLSWNIDKDLA